MLLVLERGERYPPTAPLVKGREAWQRLEAARLHLDWLRCDGTQKRRLLEHALAQLPGVGLGDLSLLLLAQRLAQRREALLECR